MSPVGAVQVSYTPPPTHRPSKPPRSRPEESRAWSTLEDEVLSLLVLLDFESVDAAAWGHLAHYLPGRTSWDVRKRYLSRHVAADGTLALPQGKPPLLVPRTWQRSSSRVRTVHPSWTERPCTSGPPRSRGSQD